MISEQEEQQRILMEQDSQRRVAQMSIEDQQRQFANIIDEKNAGIVAEQLDMKTERKNIENILRGNVRKEVDGEEVWVAPKNDSEILLIEQGVQMIMRRVNMYLTKNIILSNISEEIIDMKMEDIAESLNDEFLMKFEQIFKFPTEQEIQDELIKIADRQAESIIFNGALRGEVLNLETEKQKIFQRMDLVRERERMADILKKNKMKSYEGLMRSVQDCIHFTLLRALNGMERKSLRQMQSETTIKNPDIVSNQRSSGGIKSWFKR